MLNTVDHSLDIKLLCSGDETAFSRVYEQFSGQVYRLAFRFLKSKELSEEIVQETFIKLWVNRSKLEVEGNLWLYLYVLAKRLCLNELRKVSHSEELFAKLLIDTKDASNQTEEEIVAADLEKFTTSLLNKLPSQQQIVFKLSRVDGLTHQQIANQLQISSNTVKNHMTAALKTIKSNLKQSDLTYVIALAFLLEK
ncbi:RNA polymerase sigma factor [Pedobacter helvus]|uniref:RNA polymerase sigma factor n=1 Tax=Pedobacter helvus TaxID=2563444 RepID=A0ABW9JMP5_9SPHI|nr:RNA polymerase sigma-70 factor [Pedobacter ureilyticus]